MKILVINAGSSSLKYQLINMDDNSVIAKGLCERIGAGGAISGKTGDGRKFAYDIDLPDHTVAFNEVKKSLCEGDCKVIDSLTETDAVGHRVVQGGALFKESQPITQEVEDGIEKLASLSPLHNPAHLLGIRACKEVFGPETLQVAVFDNAFHSTMPASSYTFAIPYEISEKYDIRKYGFHGTSHKYLTHRYAELTGKDIKDTKIVTCHLGNGSSVTAIKGGKVLDTSMGLTPLDGLIMGTRSGCIDASAVTLIAKNEGLTPDEMSDLLNKKSGFLGVSGVSSDMRDVEKAAKEGNERAQLALDMLYYQIKKLIGGYAAAMDGIDAIIFAGGIGENSADTRAEVLNGLSFLGVKLDEEENKIRTDEHKITTDDSCVEGWVIATNEELEIALDVKKIYELH